MVCWCMWTEANAVLEGWRKVGLYLFGFGFVLGPPLDAIHSRVELQIYDRGALDIAGLHTDIWVRVFHPWPCVSPFNFLITLLYSLIKLFLTRNCVPLVGVIYLASNLCWVHWVSRCFLCWVSSIVLLDCCNLCLIIGWHQRNESWLQVWTELAFPSCEFLPLANELNLLVQIS